MLKEFQEFIAKGNVLDLAVGVIIGGAFGKIVESLVKDILTPALTPLTGDPKHQSFATYTAGPFAIGDFVNNIIQFLIVAFALFLIVKAVNSARTRFEKKQEEAPAEPPAPDANTQIIAQNDKIIALLEKIAAQN